MPASSPSPSPSLAGLALGGLRAWLSLPLVTYRLVVRLERMLADYGEALERLVVVLDEVGPALRRLVPVLDELAPVLSDGAPALRTLLPALEAATPALEELQPLLPLLRDGAPLLRRLLPVLEAATPALEQLAPVGNDLVPVLAEAAPGLRELVPLLDQAGPALATLVGPGGLVPQLQALLVSVPPDDAAAVVRSASELLPQLAGAAAQLPDDVLPRLLALLGGAESGLSVLGVVGDPELGMAAVVGNTDHLVDLLDELMGQVRSLPGAGVLLRRSRRKVGDAELG